MGPDAMSVEDFLGGRIALLDKDIHGRVGKASLNGNVLRYVFVIEGSRYSSHYFETRSKCWRVYIMFTCLVSKFILVVDMQFISLLHFFNPPSLILSWNCYWCNKNGFWVLFLFWVYKILFRLNDIQFYNLFKLTNSLLGI